MPHPSGIPEKIVRKVVARRGRLHAFEAIDSKATALVVIDLDEATVLAGGQGRITGIPSTSRAEHPVNRSYRPTGETGQSAGPRG